MNNMHLEVDYKKPNFQTMKLERRESTNEIIAIDGSVSHHYSYKSRKKLNADWKVLMDNVHKSINNTTMLNNDKANELNNKLNKVIYSKAKPVMWFKDEGGYYVTKFHKGEPIDGNEMYEFGTLTEQTVTNKREAVKLANSFGRTAVWN